MRLLLTGLVFVASLAAVVLVHAPRAHAAWERPQQIDAGSAPRVRLTAERPVIGYLQPSTADARRLLSGEGNEPITRVRVPRAGRVIAFDVDGGGKITALRAVRRPRTSSQRLVAYEGTRWRTLTSSMVGAETKLAVAPSGAAVVAWLQKERSQAGVHAALRAPGARRFGAPQRLSGLTSSSSPIAAAVDDAGTAVVAFNEGGDLTMARTVSGQFTSPVRVHDRTDTTAASFRFEAAVRGDVAVVAFTRLEDREPPEYRLEAATQTGDTAPVVETVAMNVSAFDVAAAVEVEGTPLVLAAPIGPPYSLRLFRRTEAWSEAAAYPAADVPSGIGLAVAPVAGAAPCVTWTEVGDRGFAAVGAAKLTLGRAVDPDCAVDAAGRALAVWDRGPGRSQRLAAFTP